MFVRRRGAAMKFYDVSEFGKMIRQKRKALGYTQKDISEIGGFSVSFISDLERGKPTIELGKAISLANLLAMDLSLQNRGE